MAIKRDVTAGEWTRDQLRELMDSRACLCKFGGFSAFRSEEEKRAAWEDRREELVAEYMKKSPGARPNAWWVLDAPERPRILERVEDPLEEYGKNVGGVGAIVEASAATLDRLGELTDAEREALDPDDYEPRLVHFDQVDDSGQLKFRMHDYAPSSDGVCRCIEEGLGPMPFLEGADPDLNIEGL